MISAIIEVCITFITLYCKLPSEISDIALTWRLKPNAGAMLPGFSPSLVYNYHCDFGYVCTLSSLSLKLK